MRFPLSYRSNLISVCIVILFLLLASWAQRVHDVGARSPEALKKAIFLDLQPPLLAAPTAKKVSFGFDNALADWHWINLIQTLSLWRGDNRSVAQKIDLITTLDPRFEYPYVLGIFLIPYYDRIDEALSLGAKGMKALPESWRIPFYLGVQISYKGDSRAEAIEFLKIAQQKKDHPKMVDLALAGISSRAGKYEVARNLWQQIYLTEDDPTLKEQALAWLRRLDALENIKQGIIAFQGAVGRPPLTVGEAVDRGYIKGIPPEFADYVFKVTPDGNLEIERFTKWEWDGGIKR